MFNYCHIIDPEYPENWIEYYKKQINLMKREKTALKPMMGATEERELSWQIH